MNSSIVLPAADHRTICHRANDEVGRVIRRWPVGVPLLALCSGGEVSSRNRWTILARPSVVVRSVGGRTEVVPARGCGRIENNLVIKALQRRVTHDPVGDLVSMLDAAEDEIMRPSGNLSMVAKDHAGVPFCGGWIGYISYDLGVCLEPSARFGVFGKQTSRGGVCSGSEGEVGGANYPLFELAWCSDAVVYDCLEDCWYEFGEPPVRVDVPVEVWDSRNDFGYSLGAFEAESDREEAEEAVARTIEYIRAGDIFQANISRRFVASFTGSRRGLFLQARERNPAWYGAYLELDEERAILSLSPELFVSFDGVTREIITRPIKGTEPIEVEPAVLENSVKDQAELNMIVDLMRNDLGRVCEYGSVGVVGGRKIESHGTVHHGVATVAGRVCRGLRIGDILKAIFPGGSITGAPKIRAMQIIDELEDFKRGPFFGSIGFAGKKGACFNLAIRTMLIERDQATYVAGSGIVADSDPGREYEEMLVKVRAAVALCS